MTDPDSENNLLIHRARHGDRQAFGSLLERHYHQIYRLAYRCCGIREDAEEIAQEVCLKLVRSLGEFRGEAAFSTWLHGLTLNAARDYLRSRRTRWEREDDGLELDALPGTTLDPERHLLSRLILRCIALLPETLRSAVLLVHSEGLNHRQAGQALGCAEGTVSWRLSEARKRLSLCLDQGG
ncbi:MAG: RNA polymerase sigma factor [Magnetococcales bacterium]|nr:RNA polymerase sigma factor [Magnetococcales bacterium]